jgi:hypothetical protein
VNLDSWVRDYARRAHGAANTDSEAAWAILQETAFTNRRQLPTAYTKPPSLRPANEPPYRNERLVQAWQRLLDAAATTRKSDAYRFDLASVTRQVLGNYSAELHGQALEAWRARDRQQFGAASQQMLGLIRDLDELLATRPEYLLGRWLDDAKRWGADTQERDRLEWNARRVLTMWGEKTNIRDYSRREWSGMLSGFYLKRWEKFFAALDAALATGSEFDEAAFDRNLQDWERRWADQHESYPRRARGDTVAVSRRLWSKYQPPLADSFKLEAPSLTTGKRVTCSSALPGSPAYLANDGRLSRTEQCWATDIAKDADPWWQVDFEQPTTVGRVVIVGYYGDERHYGFTVEASLDGREWETVADRRDNRERSTREGYTCNFKPRQARYLRVRQTYNSANTGRHLVEVMAFEK